MTPPQSTGLFITPSWQKETEIVSQKQKEIFPDRDATFLGCGARRRKRSPQGCSIASILNQKIDQRGDNLGNIEETYPASGLKLTLHGNAYQLKLNALFLKRGLDAGYQFKLATEMDAAEKFDDLVFKYVKNDKTFYTFLQAKHKQTDGPDNNKKITKSDLFNTSDGEFSLPKYLESYLKTSNNAQFLDSSNKNFILSTNIGFDLDLGSIRLIKIESTEYANKGLDFLSTKYESGQEIGEMYRLDIQSNDYDKLREGSDLNTLARELAKHLLKGEKMDLRNTIFKEYHVALVTKSIIDLNTKKLYTSFKTDPTVKDFREAFVKEALSLKKNKKAIFKDESALWMAIQDKSFQYTDALEVFDKLCQFPPLTSTQISTCQEKRYLAAIRSMPNFSQA